MAAVSLPILFLGDADRQEFREAAKALIDRGAIVAVDLSAAQTKIDEGMTPALIVIAQSWPNQFSQQQVESLRRAAPLARIIRLLGTWMEGDGRTGRPWPGTIRANWQRWDARAAGELARLSLPVTAGEDDRLLAASGARSDRDDARMVAVHAQTREIAESLLELCGLRGWSTVWLRNDVTPHANADCVLFDARDTSPGEIQALARLKSLSGEVPIVALVGFPRVEDLERFKSAGASAVVAKPYLADDLILEIEQLLPHTAARQVN